MQKKTMVVFLLLTVFLVCMLGTVGYSNMGTYTAPFTIEIEPLTSVQKNEPVTMSLSFGLSKDWKQLGNKSGSVRIVINDSKHVTDTIEVLSRDVEFDKNLSYSGTFQIIPPDFEIVEITVFMTSGKVQGSTKKYFINIGDDIEYLNSANIRGSRLLMQKRNSRPAIGDPDIDTLTETHLSVLYEVVLDFRKAKNKENAEKILGKISAPSKSTEHPGGYTLAVSLGDLIKLAEMGIDFEYVTPPPWEKDKPRYKNKKD